jgi:CRISPR-associated protein Cas2
LVRLRDFFALTPRQVAMFYLVCFDITDDRTRSRVAKALKGCGYRVQKSVFECPDLTEKGFLKLKDRLDGLIDKTTDSIRYYRQCQGCLKGCEFSGTGMPPEIEDYKVY